LPKDRMGRSEGLAFIKSDGTFYLSSRFSTRTLQNFKRDWNEFSSIDKSKKVAIIDAIKDDYDPRRPFARFEYFDVKVEDYLEEFQDDNES